MPLDFRCYGEGETVWSRRRRVLISVPGGDAYGRLKDHLGKEMQTVWLGSDVHPTMSKETSGEDHPYCVEGCPYDKGMKPCWQCVYIGAVHELLAQGCELVACTTNVFHPAWVAELNAGSSELPGEEFQHGPPAGWGCGTFGEEEPMMMAEAAPRKVKCRVLRPRDDFEVLRGIGRRALEQKSTGRPLGVGCRWERRFLDSLDAGVLVVAQPPDLEELPEFFYLENKLCGLVLGVANDDTSEGAEVVMWRKHGGDGQQWKFTPEGYLEGKLSGLVLDIRFGEEEPYQTLQMRQKYGGASQMWLHTHEGFIRSKLHGLVLDIADDNCESGTKLSMCKATGKDQQLWITRRV